MIHYLVLLLDPNGWQLSNDLKHISQLDETKDKEKIFYKERWIKENELEQKD